MESLLRSCYKEAELLGANSITFENRSKTIQRILDQKEINKETYNIIARWLMGNVNEEIETPIIVLEKNFCMDDKEFSIKDEKEMKVLCAVLLLCYCKNHTDVISPLRILCGNGINKKLPCLSLYQQFQELVDNSRIKSREITDAKYQIKATGIKALKNSISDKRKDLAEDEYNYSVQQLDQLFNVIELQDQNIKILEKENNELQKQITCQREESDVLWWMINEWSTTYKKVFPNLTAEEMAIAIPIELNQNSKYDLLPYSVERIISSLFNKYNNKAEKKCLSDYMKNIDDSIIEAFDIDEDCIEVVQPILGAICCMKNCGTEEAAWKGMSKKKYGINADEISMFPIDFAKHFCLELELMNHLQQSKNSK